MSEPWINPGFMAKRKWSQGEIMYDVDKQVQGKALWRVIHPGERSHGLWMVSSLEEVVEDEHLIWWLRKGPILERRREFFLHLCHDELATCRVFNGKDDTSFHTDFLRLIEPKDIVRRRAAVAGRCRKD